MAIIQGSAPAMALTLQESSTLLALWVRHDAGLVVDLEPLAPVHVLPMLGSMGESVRSLAFALPFGGMAGSLYRQSRILELLAYSLHCLGCPLRREARKTGEDSLLVQKARQIQEADLACPPGIPELCRALGTNETRINAAFQRILGCTPYEHVKAQRLQKARTLLRETDLSVGEVARRVGYTSQAHFSVLFHRSTGMPPRDFRKAALSGSLES
jgi:AraC-like DNA-binding protein